MISNLSIKNYALIEYSSLNFNEGFSIITGETGAGKSILLDALGLVLGKRADLSALRNKEDKCVVEATFQIQNYDLKNFFEENDLDYEQNTIIRREILPSGKSRIFVNDSPSTLAVVAELGNLLIDIHSQHQTHHLFQDKYHINIIDALANNGELLKEYKENLSHYKLVSQQLNSVIEQKQNNEKEYDYNLYLLQELQNANLQEGQQEQLEAELNMFSNTELVSEIFAKTNNLLNDEQYGILQNLSEIRNSLQKITNVSKNYEEIYQRIQSVEIELKDLNREVENIAENIVSNPDKLNEISEKLQIIYGLQKKHQVSNISDLINIQNNLLEKTSLLENIDNEIAKLQEEQEKLHLKLQTLGEKISSQRQEVTPMLIAQLKELMAMLGMPNANFEYQLEVSNQFFSNGINTIEVLFSANKGLPFTPLKKVASGGEMSRIMLSIKAILSKYEKLPTIIFDEIDTGVSGEIADKMAEIMKQMSQYMQVFSITHLPQVASKGDYHYKVSKNQNTDMAISEIHLLAQEERITEIAKMLSGNKITDFAILNAKELLTNNNK